MTKRKVATLGASIVACFLAFLGVALYGEYTHHRELRRRSEGAKALRNIAAAMLQHAESHAGIFPVETDAFTQELAKAGISLISPNERTANSKYSYIRVLPAEPSVPGPTGLHSVLDPRDIMMYENPDNYGRAGTVVAYLAGHVLWRTMPELQQELANTAKRRGLSTSQPTTAPLQVE